MILRFGLAISKPTYPKLKKIFFVRSLEKAEGEL